MCKSKYLHSETVQIAFVCYALNRLENVQDGFDSSGTILKSLNHVFESYVKNKEEASKIKIKYSDNLTPEFERLIPLDVP